MTKGMSQAHNAFFMLSDSYFVEQMVGEDGEMGVEIEKKKTDHF